MQANGWDPKGSTHLSLELLLGRGLREKQLWAASLGSYFPMRSLVSSSKLWCSPAQPQALLILTATRRPTSLTQECAQCLGLGLSCWPWLLQSLGMKAGSGVLLPHNTKQGSLTIIFILSAAVKLFLKGIAFPSKIDEAIKMCGDETREAVQHVENLYLSPFLFKCRW